MFMNLYYKFQKILFNSGLFTNKQNNIDWQNKQFERKTTNLSHTNKRHDRPANQHRMKANILKRYQIVWYTKLL